MLCGSRHGFALEAEIDELDPNRVDLVFGRLCLWAAGHRIGDLSRQTILSVPATFFVDVLKFQNNRADNELCRQSPALALSSVYDALYGRPTGDLKEALELEARYRKFCIAPGGGEAFDGVLSTATEIRVGMTVFVGPLHMRSGLRSGEARTPVQSQPSGPSFERAEPERSKTRCRSTSTVKTARILDAVYRVLAILIECGSRERLVWRTEEDDTSHEIWLGQGECESVLLEFLTWLEELSGFWPDGLTRRSDMGH